MRTVKLFLTFLVISLLFISVTTAETTWGDNVSEEDSIEYVIPPTEFSNSSDILGLGEDASPKDTIIVNPTSGMTSEFDLVDGDRLELTVTHNDNTVDVSPNSDYHLVFLPFSIDGTSIFDILFSNYSLVEQFTGGTVVNSSIDSTPTLHVSFGDTYDVEYKWDSVTATLVEKTIKDAKGNQLRLIPQPNYGLVSYPLDILVLSLSTILGVLLVRRKN